MLRDESVETVETVDGLDLSALTLRYQKKCGSSPIDQEECEAS
jgi:hypothetical protein